METALAITAEFLGISRMNAIPSARVCVNPARRQTFLP